jgi:large subunit ribosomal protein L25
MHVSDLKVAENVEILTDPETVIATVSVVREEEVEPAAEEPTVEPEVIGKGKKDEEGGEA